MSESSHTASRANHALNMVRALPDLHGGEPPPEAEHPFAKIRRGQAEGYAQLFIFGMGPAMAALVGGGLTVVWSVVLAVWRLIDNRKPQ
jgi:hypothetical protein